MQKLRDEIKLIKINEVKIIIEGRIYKNTMDMYFKYGCMPILWKKIYGRDVNVNRKEKHYCHFNKR